MTVRTLHPEITKERQQEWALMRASDTGESEIKKKGETYLPKPSGFDAMANPSAAYTKYKSRATFPEILSASIGAMVGLIHGRESKIAIAIPPALEYLWEEATNDDTPLPLEAFHRKITRELLLMGRYGVLVDAPMDGGNPFLAGYCAERIINWRKGLYVIDESDIRPKPGEEFQWEDAELHRVLKMDDGRYAVDLYEDGVPIETLETAQLGGVPMQEIPFVVANARDVEPTIEQPPLIGIARAAVGIYQLDADYRYQLFMSGQETLVAINGDAPEYVGAGVVHEMQGSEGITPDLKYVTPACSGIEAHLTAIRDKREQAIMAGARLLEQSPEVEESGSARELRFSSESASLMSVAVTSCALLERSLRYCAMMLGQNPDQVTVTPPKRLMDKPITGQEAVAMMQLWQGGAIAYETLYENLREGGIASSERDHEQEFSLLDGEQITGPQAGP